MSKLNGQVNSFLCGHVLDVLRTLPEESVDMCITSPPYYGLRSYDGEAQVWGGDSGCKHDFSILAKIRCGNNSTIRGVNEKYANQVRVQKEIILPEDADCVAMVQAEPGSFSISKKLEGIKQGYKESLSCRKCGAWQGQLGLEPTPQLFIEHLVAVFKEVRRVLKASGSLWVNIGDSYSGNRWSNSPSSTGKSRPCSDVVIEKQTNLPAKSMIGIPERFMLAMMDEGWILRNKIIWGKQILYPDDTTKGSVMPSSVKDRFNQSWEYLYFFTKSQKYYFDLDAVRSSFSVGPRSFNIRVRDAQTGRLKMKYGNLYKASEKEIENYKERRDCDCQQCRPRMGNRGGQGTLYESKGKLAEGAPGRSSCGLERKGHSGNCDKEGNSLVHPLGKNPPTVWYVPTEAFPGQHFAVYPQELLRRPILAACPPGGIVLDPFMGSGTTALAALKLGRKFIGVDASEKYCKMAQKRVEERYPLLVQKETINV